jgi:hypothetical protein
MGSQTMSLQSLEPEQSSALVISTRPWRQSRTEADRLPVLDTQKPETAVEVAGTNRIVDDLKSL